MRKMSKKEKNNRDKIQLRQKKGTWRRFAKTLLKCRLPWVWLAVYVVLYFGFITVGVDVTDRTAQLFAGDVSAQLVTSLIGLMILNVIGDALTGFISQVVSARTNRNMRNSVLQKVLRLPLGFFKEENPRETIYRIVNNSIVVDSTVMLFIIPLFGGMYTMIQVFLRVFKYDWRLSLVMIVFVPVVLFLAFLFGRINFSLSEKDSGLLASLTQRLSEMMTNIPLAKAFAKETNEEEKGKELTARLYKINIKSSWFDQFQSLSETVVNLLQAAAITITGLILIRDGSLDRRAWVSFFMFSSVFMTAVADLTMLWNNIKIIQGNADRLSEIMNAEEEPKGGEPCGQLSGGIHMENIRFGYTEEKTVLNGISCDFPENTVTALLGVSGCGKTTTVNLITRLYQPQDGKVIVGSRDISEFALDDYRKNFAVVSQNTMLFSGSVRENVSYGNENVTEQQLIDALKNAGAYDFVMNLSGGLDAMLEEYGNNLSGGQRQRLAMARALLSDTPFLILDEPVASMDAVAIGEMMDILARQAKQRCVIVIAHSPAVLKLAEHVIVMENGHIESEGSVPEVIQSSSFVKDFMRGAVSE